MTRTKSFEHAPGAVPAARRFAAEVLRRAPAEAREAVTLMISELATNCIRHTDSGFDLSISHTPEEIRVEATDCGDSDPRVRSPGPADPSGRGLRIVEMFATAWGFERVAAEGKTVWFTVALPLVAASPIA